MALCTCAGHQQPSAEGQHHRHETYVRMSGLPAGTAWHAKLPDIPKLGRPLKVALPCVGIDGCTHALHVMATDFQPTNIYDLEGGYSDFLRQHYAEAHVQGQPTMNLGTSGDICCVDLRHLEKPDGLCSGPPCPPWAGQGRKKSQEDERARVFERVLQWVVLFIKAGPLLFCVLENVVGILHRIKGQRSFMSRVLAVLREECQEFAWVVHKLKAMDYGLPQSRTRVFLVGVRKAVFGDQPPTPLPAWDRNAELCDFLSARAPNTDRASLTSNMQHNLGVHEGTLKMMLQQQKLGEKDIVSVCVDRSPTKKWKPKLHINRIPTLTTSNVYIFVMSLDFGKADHERAVFRWLLPGERLILQGFPATCAGLLPARLRVKASGNAYPVPLMAAMLTPIVQGLQGKIEHWPMPSGTVDVVPGEVHEVVRKLYEEVTVTVTVKKRPAQASTTRKKKAARAHIAGPQRKKTSKTVSAVSISSDS